MKIFFHMSISMQHSIFIEMIYIRTDILNIHCAVYNPQQIRNAELCLSNYNYIDNYKYMYTSDIDLQNKSYNSHYTLKMREKNLLWTVILSQNSQPLLPVLFTQSVFPTIPLQNGALPVLGPRVFLLVGGDDESVFRHLLVDELNQPANDNKLLASESEIVNLLTFFHDMYSVILNAYRISRFY